MDCAGVVVCAAVAITIAGCGGAPTHDEFVTRAEKVCERHNGRLTRIAREGSERAPLNREELRIWTNAYFDAYEDMVDALTDLDRPVDDPAVDRYLDRLQESVRIFHSGDTNAFERLSPPTRSLAEDAGLTACNPFGG